MLPTLLRYIAKYSCSERIPSRLFRRATLSVCGRDDYSKIVVRRYGSSGKFDAYPQ